MAKSILCPKMESPSLIIIMKDGRYLEIFGDVESIQVRAKSEKKSRTRRGKRKLISTIESRLDIALSDSSCETPLRDLCRHQWVPKDGNLSTYLAGDYICKKCKGNHPEDED